MALKKLEARYATKQAKDYKLADAEGLYLLVRPNGSKLWRFEYRFAGKEKLLSFGAYPKTSLADARLRRAEARVALGQGIDPGQKTSWCRSRRSSRPPEHGMPIGWPRSMRAMRRGC